jgi:Leucine-rich repeat (LRR) protein
MGKLKELIVSENRLISLPQNINPNCPLQQLDLHSNQLTSLPSDLLAHTSR